MTSVLIPRIHQVHQAMSILLQQALLCATVGFCLLQMNLFGAMNRTCTVYQYSFDPCFKFQERCVYSVCSPHLNSHSNQYWPQLIDQSLPSLRGVEVGLSVGGSGDRRSGVTCRSHLSESGVVRTISDDMGSLWHCNLDMTKYGKGVQRECSIMNGS